MSAEYLQPKSFEELESSLLRLTDKSVILAGGTDLLPKIRSGKKEPDIYLSLCRLEKLGNIERQGDWLKIGAMATHEQAADNPLIREYFTGLAMACSRVGSRQIRNKGTLGGSLANASPAGDIMPCVFLYGGKIEIVGKEGIRFVKQKNSSQKTDGPFLAEMNSSHPSGFLWRRGGKAVLPNWEAEEK